MCATAVCNAFGCSKYRSATSFEEATPDAPHASSTPGPRTSQPTPARGLGCTLEVEFEFEDTTAPESQSHNQGRDDESETPHHVLPTEDSDAQRAATGNLTRDDSLLVPEGLGARDSDTRGSPGPRTRTAGGRIATREARRVYSRSEATCVQSPHCQRGSRAFPGAFRWPSSCQCRGHWQIPGRVAYHHWHAWHGTPDGSRGWG